MSTPIFKMIISQMKLHKYQEDDVSTLVEHIKKETCAVVYATGSGKTVVARTVASLLGMPFVIAAPTNNIKASFTDNKTVILGDDQINLIPVKAYQDSQKVRLNTYLMDTNPGYGVVVSHNLLAGIELTQSCSNRLLIVDEAHHAGETQRLAKGIDDWKRLGGLVLFLTATPIRANNEPSLASQAQYKVERTISQQMREGFAPAEIDFDLVCIDSDVHGISDYVFGAPMDVEMLAEEIVHQLKTDGLPKTIIRCKNLGNPSRNDDVIETISSRLKAEGLRVLSATARTQLSDLEDALSKERELTNVSDSEIDVIVGINAVCEGLDWPLASHFYFVGVPTTITLTIQGVGRTMRRRMWEHKLQDYPQAWVDMSKMVMFTGNVRDIKSKHTSTILRVISYLGSLKQLPVLELIRERFNNRIGAEATEQVLKSVEYPINENALPYAVAAVVEIQRLFYKKIHACSRLSRKNIKDLFLFLKSEGNYAQCEVGDVAVALAMNTKKDREDYTARVRDSLDRENLDGDTRQAIRQAFDKINAEFLDDTEVSIDSGTVFGKVQTIHVDSDVIDVFSEKVEEIHEKVSWKTATS